MHDETVETYTNVYARWFAIISQFIVTASLCTLWWLQMTRYSQVLVHSTVVNSRLSHQYMSISLIFLAVLGFIVISATFCRVFAGFCAEFGCCFGDFCSFSYFFSAFLRLYGWVWEAVLGFSAVSATFSRLFSGFMAGFGKLFWGFLQFQLLFSGFSPAFELGLGCCFGDFCSFSYFLRGFWHNGGSPTP